jgi:hypothetical protein
MRRQSSLATSVLVLASLTLLASQGAAQDPSPLPPPSPQSPADLAPPLFVAHIDGDVTLTRDGSSTPLEINVPIVEGDRVRTGGGRLELAGTPWGGIFLDERTAIDVPSYGRVRLLEGCLRASVNEEARTALRIETPAVSLMPSDAGDFLVEVTPDQIAVRVSAGSVELVSDRGATMVREGQVATIRGMGAPVLGPIARFAGRVDFDRWVDDRLEQYRSTSDTANASSLPPALSSYDATLSQYGSWGVEPDYGEVWYPTVSADWQPYASGRWDFVGRYGWFWIGADAWAWPTHHYGRWGYRNDRWFWQPRATWAPSWVSWAVGPGYVGWSPLGADNRPVFAFGSSSGATYTRGRRPVRDDHWRGWNVMPSQHLGDGRVGGHLVDGRSLPSEITSAFVTQRVPPPHGSRYAVPRGSAPGIPLTAADVTSLSRGRPTRIDPPAPPGRGYSAGYGTIAVPGPGTGSPYDRARPHMRRPGAASPSPAPGSGEPSDSTPGAIPRGAPSYGGRVVSPPDQPGAVAMPRGGRPVTAPPPEYRPAAPPSGRPETRPGYTPPPPPPASSPAETPVARSRHEGGGEGAGRGAGLGTGPGTQGGTRSGSREGGSPPPATSAPKSPPPPPPPPPPKSPGGGSRPDSAGRTRVPRGQ